MDYKDIRQEIKSGHVLAWSHEGWGSWHDVKIQVVRMATRSAISHVGIAWVVGSRVFVIEAVEPMIRIFPLSQLGDFYWYPVDCEWSDDVEEAALSHVGKEYKSMNAIKAFFVSLNKGDVSECAALVITVANSMGIDLGTRMTPDAVVLKLQELGVPQQFVNNDKEVVNVSI